MTVTLAFTPAIVNASGFLATDYVERVDVLPEISLVNSGADESFQSLDWQKSIVDFTNSEVEDEYKLTVGTPQEDFIAKLKLRKATNDASGRTIYAKRLGNVLNT